MKSALEDIFIGFQVYDSSRVRSLLKSESYNCGIWADKLIMEALSRLPWQAFCKWVQGNEISYDVYLTNNKLQECQNAVLKMVQQISQQTCAQLSDALKNVQDVLYRFCNYGTATSQTFAF